MLKRPTTWIAAGLWLFILGVASAIVAMKANGWQGAGNTSDTSGVALFLALFAFATMGGLVAAHVPGNAIGWIFLGIPLGGALAGITENLAFQGLYHDPGSVPGAIGFAWVYAWVWYPTVGLLGFVLLLYPTGKVPGPRWRFVAWALGVVLAVMTLGYMFYPGPLDKDTRLPDNPLGIQALRGVFDRSDTAASISVAGLVIARQRPGTAKGTMFLLFEDEWGTVNLIVSRDVYERHRQLARAEPLLLARGRLERAEGVVNVIVRELAALERFLPADLAAGEAAAVARVHRLPARGRPQSVTADGPPGEEQDAEVEVSSLRAVAPPVQSFAMGRRR